MGKELFVRYEGKVDSATTNMKMAKLQRIIITEINLVKANRLCKKMLLKMSHLSSVI